MRTSAVADHTEGRKPLTVAQRQATHRQRRADEAARWKAALEAIHTARTIREAREIATAALAGI